VLYELDPWGTDRDDWRIGQLTALVSNLFREKGSQPKPAGAFMWVTLTTPKPKQTGQEILDQLRTIAVPKRIAEREKKERQAKLAERKRRKEERKGKD
jgi:hypothetical protein